MKKKYLNYARLGIVSIPIPLNKIEFLRIIDFIHKIALFFIKQRIFNDSMGSAVVFYNFFIFITLL